MKRPIESKALTIFGLFFLSTALIIGISFLGINQLLRSNSIGGDVFAQGINKKIYSIESSYKFQENMVSIFWWDYGRKGMGPKGVKDEVEPIFMYRDGQLIDPSEEGQRIGFEMFIRKWFEGKIHPVYFRGREVGSLSDFSMKVGYTGRMKRCKDELWGEAIYKGEDAGGTAFSKRIGKTDALDRGATLFALAKKDPIIISKEKRERGQVTEGDIKKMEDNGGVEFEKMIQRLKKNVKQVEVDLEEKRPLGLWAIDLNTNGKFDLVGEFEVLLRYKYFGDQKSAKESPVQYVFNMLYALYDDGTGEIVWPSFQNGISFDGASSIVGFFDLGESRPIMLVRSRYPTTFHRYQSEPYQYELLAYRGGKGWVNIFKGKPKRHCK